MKRNVAQRDRELKGGGGVRHESRAVVSVFSLSSLRPRWRHNCCKAKLLQDASPAACRPIWLVVPAASLLLQKEIDKERLTNEKSFSLLKSLVRSLMVQRN